jgi:RNase adaptor protein for sRNA GlmZ degradation
MRYDGTVPWHLKGKQGLLVVDTRRLYRKPGYSQHHLSQADGFNDKLVLELTRHGKFPKIVSEAKEQLQVGIDRGDAEIHLGVRCNGGKQRSVGFSRLLKTFLGSLGYTVLDIEHMGSWRHCGCATCTTPNWAAFNKALTRFAECWDAV